MKLKINIAKSLLIKERCPIGSGVNSRRKRSLTLPDSLQYEVEFQLYNQLMDKGYQQSVAKQSSPLKAQPDIQLLEVDQINHRTYSERHPNLFRQAVIYIQAIYYYIGTTFLIKGLALLFRYGFFEIKIYVLCKELSSSYVGVVQISQT